MFTFNIFKMRHLSLRRPWFYRMLLSYVPIFFIITSFLFFIFFQELSAQTKREAMKANQLLAIQAMDRVEYSLKSIDYALVNLSLNNKIINQFFQQRDTKNVFLNIQVLQEIDKIKQQNSLIDSIYLVRFNDNIVLSEKALFHLKEYPDYPFIRKLSQLNKKQPFQWTGSRKFKEFFWKEDENVVSLVRAVYTINGDEGFIVVNVKSSSIKELVTNILNPQVSFISILGENGSPLFNNKELGQESVVLTQVKSSYTGWTFESGLVNGKIFGAISMLSSIWVRFGIVTVILGIFLIIYITRRNYKPLETIVSNIQSFSVDKPDNFKDKVNEFKMIESALENISARASKFQQQYEQDLELRKNHFFYEIIEGIRHVSDDEWKSEMIKYHLPENFYGAHVIIIEIDNYHNFCMKYSQRDQYLLKYAIKNVADEIFDKFAIKVWGQWTAARRLTFIIQITEHLNHKEFYERICHVFEELRQWIKYHLKFTLTIGIGSRIESVNEISDSYKDAKQAIEYKVVKGTDRVIDYNDIANHPEVELFKYLQTIQSFAYSFRFGEEEWRSKLEQLFHDMRCDVLSREETDSLMNYLIFQLDRGISEMNAEFQGFWKEKGKYLLEDTLEKSETLEDIQRGFSKILFETAQFIRSLQLKRSHHQLINDVREYIKQNYMNPDLSLDLLSHEFGINAKYLSQLFKDEFGERFMDFLISQRIEQAKSLLIETEEQIQDISVKVGYLNVISFTRAFKKVTGFSPGDYRRKMQGRKAM